MLAEADMSVTQMAMGGENSHVGDEQLLVKFFIKAKENQTMSREAGRKIFVDTEYIRIIQPGNKDSIVERPASEMDRNRFKQHYAAFKSREGDQERIVGTPIEAWHVPSPSQVAELKYMNVLTVEQLAGLSDANIQGMMGINVLKQKAKAFLDVSETAKAAEEMSELRSTNERLQEQLSKLQAQFDAIREQESATKAPAKRGRPRKTDSEES